MDGSPKRKRSSHRPSGGTHRPFIYCDFQRGTRDVDQTRGDLAAGGSVVTLR